MHFRRSLSPPENRKCRQKAAFSERVKKVFLTRSQTENASLVFRRSKLRILRPAASGRPHPLRCCSSPNRNRFAGFLFGWAWKRLASCCAHNLCAAGTQIPHLQDEQCFVRGTRPRTKRITFYSAVRGGTLRGFFDRLRKCRQKAAFCLFMRTAFEVFCFCTNAGLLRYAQTGLVTPVLRSLERPPAMLSVSPERNVARTIAFSPNFSRMASTAVSSFSSRS